MTKFGIITLSRKEMLNAVASTTPSGQYYLVYYNHPPNTEPTIQFAEHGYNWDYWSGQACAWKIPQFNPHGSTALRDLALEFLINQGFKEKAVLTNARFFTKGDLIAYAERYDPPGWRRHLTRTYTWFADEFIAWLNGKPSAIAAHCDPEGPGFHEWEFMIEPAQNVILIEGNAGRLFISLGDERYWFDITESFEEDDFEEDALTIIDDTYPWKIEEFITRPEGVEIAFYNESDGVIIVCADNGTPLAGAAGQVYLGIKESNKDRGSRQLSAPDSI